MGLFISFPSFLPSFLPSFVMHLFSSDDIIRHILSSLIPHLPLLSSTFLSYPLFTLLSPVFLFYPHIPLLSIIFLFIHYLPLLSIIFLFYPLSSSFIHYLPLLSIIFLFYPPSSSPSLDDMSQGRREAFDIFRSEYAHNAVIEENKKTLKQR